MLLGGARATIPVVNVSGKIVSEVVAELAESHPFAAGWWQLDDGQVVVSLRSRSDGVNVAEIAKHEGGGGHPGAAGFTFPTIEAWLERLDVPPLPF